MERDEISIPCDMSDDFTTFWYDDGYVFSRINDGVGNRHYKEDLVELRDWLTAAIAELENSDAKD